MRKTGVSAVVSSVLMILIIFALITTIWITLVPFIKSTIKEEMKMVELSSEKLEISDVVFFSDASGNKMNITINRGATSFIEIESQTITETVSTEEPAPIDIMLMIDLSGSMCYCTLRYSPCCGYSNNGCRYDQERCESCGGTCQGGIYETKEAATDFVNTVISTNNLSRIGLVGFKDDLLTPSTEDLNNIDLTNDIPELENEISSWSVSGGTYVCEGMDKALEIFNKVNHEERQRVLVILGDGEATVNSCRTSGAESRATFLHENENISVSTIGFGPGGVTGFYERIALAGNGTFYDSSDTANLASSFTSIINNINITKEISKEVPIEGVFIEVAIVLGADSYRYVVPESPPGPNGARRFVIPLNDINPDEITEIRIYLTNIAEGESSTSRLLSSWKIK